MGTICFFVNINKALFISVVFTLFYKDKVTPDTQAKIKKSLKDQQMRDYASGMTKIVRGELLREEVGYRNTPKKIKLRVKWMDWTMV